MPVAEEHWETEPSASAGSTWASRPNVSRSDWVFGDVPLYGVMGGFHLSGPDVEKIIPETVRDLAAFGLKRIVPCHCTGWRAVHALANVYNDDVLVPAAVGRQFRF